MNIEFQASIPAMLPQVLSSRANVFIARGASSANRHMQIKVFTPIAVLG